MSLTITKYPPQVALAGNPIEAIVSTNSRYNVVPRLSRLAFSVDTGTATDDETVTISFSDEFDNDYTIVYRFRTVRVLPRDFNSFASLYNLILTDIDICKFYNVSKDVNDHINITAKKLDPVFNLTFATTISGNYYQAYSAIEAVEKSFYRIGCNVWVMALEDTGSSGISLAATLFANPGEDNTVTFDVSEFLLKEYEAAFTYPDPESDIISVKNQLRTDYKLEFFEQYYDFENETQVTTGYTATNLYYALSGKISEELLNRYTELATDWWAQYLVAKTFLTTAPQMKPVFATQPERLYFLVHTDMQSVRLYAKLYYTDTTNETVSVTELITVSQYDIIEVIATYNNIIEGEIADGKTLKYWELYLGTTGATVSASKTFVLDSTYYHKQRPFIFRNSLGAYDTFVFTGIFSQDDEFKRNAVQLENTLKDVGTEIEKNYSGNSQYLPTKEFKLYMQEFFTSPEIIEIDGDTLYRVLLSDTKAFMWRDMEHMHEISFSYMRSVFDSLFTPLDIIIYVDALAYSPEGVFTTDNNDLIGIN